MTYKLRPYQQGAVDASVYHMTRSTGSLLIEAATGAGKSLIVAEIAMWIHGKSGKKVLCLAPSKELTEQNHEKYLAYGNPASIWSASAGKKCLKHDVVFGTPKSVANDLGKFGEQFAAIIIDEAHGITPTIKKIVNHIKSCNPNVRVCGLTATPYRMNTGYIYAVDENNISLEEDETVNPFFDKLIFKITAHELIDQGYLTPPVADAKISEKYDTSGLIIKNNGMFDTSSVEQAFEGKGRKTSAIVSEVVALAQHKMGVMFFAATIQHAEEVLASLPDGRAELVTGKTPKKERESIINRFKNREYKYLVNVAVLTTGFDAPHVDVIAVLRSTESASLFQQIIGRGLRLHPDKETCLVLDYADNIGFHDLEDDMFVPKIRTSIKSSDSITVEARCIRCNTVNEFSGRPNHDSFEIDDEGYFLDLAGERIEAGENQYMPAHFGRRCNFNHLTPSGLERCDQRWSMKVCPECEQENDIAARYCSNRDCRCELVDPNEKLRLDYKKMKAMPSILSTDKVIGWRYQEWTSQKGNRSLRVDYTTEYRTLSIWYTPDSSNMQARSLWRDLSYAVFGPSRVATSIDHFIDAMSRNVGVMPETITSKKVGDFFKVFMHNQPCDPIPE